MKDYGAAFLALVLIGVTVVIIWLSLMIPADRTILADRRTPSLTPAQTVPANIGQRAASVIR
jgi:hypothetical protein